MAVRDLISWVHLASFVNHATQVAEIVHVLQLFLIYHIFTGDSRLEIFIILIIFHVNFHPYII
jgi:hypothetical protein